MVPPVGVGAVRSAVWGNEVALDGQVVAKGSAARSRPPFPSCRPPFPSRHRPRARRRRPFPSTRRPPFRRRRQPPARRRRRSRSRPLRCRSRAAAAGRKRHGHERRDRKQNKIGNQGALHRCLLVSERGPLVERHAAARGAKQRDHALEHVAPEAVVLPAVLFASVDAPSSGAAVTVPSMNMRSRPSSGGARAPRGTWRASPPASRPNHRRRCSASAPRPPRGRARPRRPDRAARPVPDVDPRSSWPAVARVMLIVSGRVARNTD